MFSRLSTRAFVLALALVTWGRAAGADDRLETLTPVQTSISTFRRVHQSMAQRAPSSTRTSGPRTAATRRRSRSPRRFIASRRVRGEHSRSVLHPRPARDEALLGRRGEPVRLERRRLDRALLPELHGRPRRYDPDLHAEPPQPPFGTAIPALKVSDTHLRAMFVASGTTGATSRSGFRSNAGVFNPWAYSVHVTSRSCPVRARPRVDVCGRGAVYGHADQRRLRGCGSVRDRYDERGAHRDVRGPRLPLRHRHRQPVGGFRVRAASDDVPAAPASSLLANGGFDAGVAGWSTVGLALAWSPADAFGNPHRARPS